jgi:hypothetical protein
MRRIGILLVLACLLAVVGCGESEESSSGGNGGGGSKGGGGSGSQDEKTASCRRAPRKVLNRIEVGLQQVPNGGKLRNGYVVRSADFKKMYIVAADIQGLGMEGKDDIGVWATNSLAEGGLTFAVDGFAQDFSDWSDADLTDPAITTNDDGVDEARSCAESA